MGRLKYTEGVKYLAEQAGAYWLIDAIASYQSQPRFVRNERLRELQLWRLIVRLDRTALLTWSEDSPVEQHLVSTQEIEFTDFPLDELTLYVEGDVLLLPSEHC